jgi:hypothetical protein
MKNIDISIIVPIVVAVLGFILGWISAIGRPKSILPRVGTILHVEAVSVDGKSFMTHHIGKMECFKAPPGISPGYYKVVLRKEFPDGLPKMLYIGKLFRVNPSVRDLEKIEFSSRK